MVSDTHNKSITACLLDTILRLFSQVVDIMRVNVDKVLERDQKLSELDDRADALQAGASQFETSAAKLKNKYWWKNAKVREANVWWIKVKCGQLCFSYLKGHHLMIMKEVLLKE